MTAKPDRSVDLRWKNGTVYHFMPANFVLGSLLASIRDPNGNTTTIIRDGSFRVAAVNDRVGRSLSFVYDGASRITSITDSIGRSVQYVYNGQGTLASVTDPAGGVTQYLYNANNNMIQVTDARGIILIHRRYNAGDLAKEVAEAARGVLPPYTSRPLH
jgi:YD repeat-containing protein